MSDGFWTNNSPPEKFSPTLRQNAIFYSPQLFPGSILLPPVNGVDAPVYWFQLLANCDKPSGPRLQYCKLQDLSVIGLIINLLTSLVHPYIKFCHFQWFSPYVSANVSGPATSRSRSRLGLKTSRLGLVSDKIPNVSVSSRSRLKRSRAHPWLLTTHNTSSSLVNRTIVTKLLIIRIKTKLVYISRRRTTSFDENDTL